MFGSVHIRNKNETKYKIYRTEKLTFARYRTPKILIKRQ